MAPSNTSLLSPHYPSWTNRVCKDMGDLEWQASTYQPYENNEHSMPDLKLLFFRTLLDWFSVWRNHHFSSFLDFLDLCNLCIWYVHPCVLECLSLLVINKSLLLIRKKLLLINHLLRVHIFTTSPINDHTTNSSSNAASCIKILVLNQSSQSQVITH